MSNILDFVIGGCFTIILIMACLWLSCAVDV
uniref:Uncharacterized protein n=1 Tax=Anguilla anguilla TaxID=7936 RepID=A0A0E9V9S0_ANGAN